MAFSWSSSSSMHVATPSFRRGTQGIFFQESTGVYPMNYLVNRSFVSSLEDPFSSQANVCVGVPSCYPFIPNNDGLVWQFEAMMLGQSPARHSWGSYPHIQSGAHNFCRDIAPLQPAAAVVTPEYENSLTYQIKKQMEYYFCDDNLAKDWFLRTNMNDEGWVPITLIATFPRIKRLTSDVPTILKSLTYSNTVEVQGNNVRRRDTWRKWPKIRTDLVTVQGFKNTQK